MTKENEPVKELTREEKLKILRAPLPEVTVQPHRTWGGCITDRRDMLSNRRSAPRYFDDNDNR
jgi:hypothetical protein